MTTVLSFLFAIALLVFVHEWGHYKAARLVGVSVEKFSIGFGRVLLSRRDRSGCEWAVSAIPLGGFVKMNEADFESRPVWARAWIVSAGPLANLVFAAVAYSLVFGLGQSEPIAVLAKPSQGSLAAQAGVLAGDRIESVNGHRVETFTDVRWYALRSLVADPSASLQIQLVRPNGQSQDVVLSPKSQASGSTAPEALFAQFGLVPQSLAVRVAGLVEGGAAQRAGLAPDEVILTANGLPVRQPTDLMAVLAAGQGQPVRLGLTSLQDQDPRQEVPGRQRELVVTPQKVVGATGAGGQPAWRIGVSLGVVYEQVHRSHGPVDAVVRGLDRTADLFVLSWQAIGRMVIGSLSWRELSGPVSIAGAAGQSAEVGLTAFLGFLALISVSIGVLNLLPVPMLDGGHLLYYLAEFVRGKPLPEQVQQIGQRVGLAAILLLTGLAIFNDVLRVFGV